MAWEISVGLGFAGMIWAMMAVSREVNAVLSQFFQLLGMWGVVAFMNFNVALAVAQPAPDSVVKAVQAGYALSLYVAYAFTFVTALILVYDMINSWRSNR